MFFYNFKTSTPFNQTDTAMGTFISQTIDCSNPSQVCESTMSLIKQLENKISWRIADSEIAKINSAKEGESIEVSEETLKIIKTSLEIAKLSGNTFSPTILPLSKIWNFNSDESNPPCQIDIAAALPILSCGTILIDEKNNLISKKNSETMFDLGAIGKGTACDIAVENYKKNKIKSGLICVGGSIGIYGNKSNHQPWNIAIRNPFTQENSASFATLDINSGFISTSGSYEKNFTYNSKFYHHILSIETGYPVETDLISVTIIHSNGTISDMLSTACFILGPKKSQDLLHKFNAQAIFLDKNKKITADSSLKEKLHITDNTFLVDEWI